MATASVSAAEIEELRFHLGYGNIDVDAYPSTPDGFYELFTQVIQPNLTTAEETTATTVVVAGEITVVTPVSMTGIAANTRLIIDTAEDVEDVVVKAITVSTFTARFQKDHAVTGYPVMVSSGVARLRMLLQSAQKAWQALQSPAITKKAGLNSVGKGEVVFFGGNAVLRETLEHYRALVQQLSSLVRVAPVDTEAHDERAGGGRIEAY